jgi:hypothetical protein
MTMMMMTKAMMMLMIKMLNTDAPTLFETQIHAKSVNRNEYNGGAHMAFMCFVRISEQTATFAL